MDKRDQGGSLLILSLQAIDVDIDDIDKHVDYHGWLNSRKRKWKKFVKEGRYKVDKSAKKRNTKEGLDLRELHMKTTTECSYLEPSTSFFYLYHRRSGYLSSVFSFLVNHPCRSGHSNVYRCFRFQGTKKFLPNGEKILRNQLDKVYFGKTKEM
ncbi:hypothetical protein Tco_1451924, partial [Tanacetum coccineum]